MPDVEQNPKYVSLVEAITWVAFRTFCPLEKLKERLRRDPACQEVLEEAAREFTEAAADGHLGSRGRYVIDFQDRGTSIASSTIDIHANCFKDFQQFDLDRVGLQRRQPDDIRVLITWATATVARSPDGTGSLVKSWNDSAAVSYARAFQSHAGALPDGDPSLADGYCEIEVLRSDLLRRFPVTSATSTVQALPQPAGRKRSLDHEGIRARGRDLRQQFPRISIGSAAASIAAELPTNPLTGKSRDVRGIERIIAPVWTRPGDE